MAWLPRMCKKLWLHSDTVCRYRCRCLDAVGAMARLSSSKQGCKEHGGAGCDVNLQIPNSKHHHILPTSFEHASRLRVRHCPDYLETWKFPSHNRQSAIRWPCTRVVGAGDINSASGHLRSFRLCLRSRFRSFFSSFEATPPSFPNLHLSTSTLSPPIPQQINQIQTSSAEWRP